MFVQQFPADDVERATLLARPRIAWPTIGLAIVVLGGFVALAGAALAGWIPWAVSVPLQAFAAFAGFTVVHDASHRSVAHARWINELVGWPCGLPILAPFAGFRYLHYAHHAFTNDRDRDPDMWSSKARSRLGIALRWTVMDVHYLFRYVSEFRTRPRGEWLPSSVFVVLMWTSWIVLIATGHGVALVLCWLLPARLAILTLSIVFDWIPHHPRRVTASEDRYRASNAYEHRWLSPPLLGQNYHLIHHLYPGVPFYRYGHVYWSLRDELIAHGADLRRIGARIETRVPDTNLDRPVLAVERETADTRTFVLGVPATMASLPGQFVVVELPVPGGVPLRRCYSISRARPGELAITVKLQGRASSWLHDHVRAGDVLRVGPPEGRFVLAPGSTRPLVLCAAGSGITPVIALVEHALASTARRVTLVYSSRADVIFKHRIDALARAHGDRFERMLHLTADAGRLDPASLAPAIDREAELYTCGPAGFVDVVDRAADLRGIPADRRRCERFTPRRATRSLEPTIASSFTAIRNGAHHLVSLAPGETLLSAARRAGLLPRASCEDGYCGTCAARLTCGRVDAVALGPLEDRDLARGFILPCSARPLALEPVVVDFDASPAA